MEKQGPGSSAGRGSAICHVATDHGRLLDALLNEDKDMTKEIEFLAEHDKGFNDAYHGESIFHIYFIVTIFFFKLKFTRNYRILFKQKAVVWP